ncbi:MAG TPA: hypothetical protein VGP74_02985 [Rubrobacteraceae bacterium]|jgi:hypothetical protein|nr:hypothetical protein [Rubrobacteraceae bacterium]
MDDLNGERRSDVVSQDWLAQAPKVSDALKKGMIVSISTWSGLEITGIVCDRDQAGLLLDVQEPEADSEGYSFLPWSSIEQVKIREVAQRRVKFLQG